MSKLPRMSLSRGLNKFTINLHAKVGNLAMFPKPRNIRADIKLQIFKST